MDNLRGALLMVISMASFALEDMFIKLMRETLSAGQIFIFIGLGGAAAFSILIISRGEAPIDRSLSDRLVLLRTIFELISSTGFVVALAFVPISLMTTIIQANPVLVTLGAALFFGEVVGRRRWTAILLGLLGVLIVLRPWETTFDNAALLVILGVVFQAGRDLVTRRIKSKVGSLQLSVFTLLAFVPFGAMLMVAQQTPPVMPNKETIIYILAAIAVSLPAFYCIVAAMRVGEISFVAPFRYTRIVFGLLIGTMIFSEKLDGIMLFGAALIVGSGFYTIIREAQLRQRPSHPPRTNV